MNLRTLTRHRPFGPSRLLIPALILLGACATATDQAAKTAPVNATPNRIRITIVGTNDLHGWLEPKEATHAGEEASLGGMSTFAGYVTILRQQRPDAVVLLDAGDMFQGTLVSNMTEGASVIKAYNFLSYDASAVGNHEFDYGPEGDASISRTASEDSVGALKKRMSEAKFPFLTGNIFDRATGEPVNWPNASRSIIIRRQGINIGIIGETTPTTPSVTLGQNVAGLEFKALLPTTLELANDLRARGAQIVILTTHAGAGCPRGSDPHDLKDCSPSEIFPLLSALPPGTLDAVVAGHSHQYLANFINGVPVIQSKSYGEAFGVIELSFDPKANRVDQSQSKIWPTVTLCRLVHADTNSCKAGTGPWVSPKFLGETVVPDVALDEAIAPDIQRVAQRKNEKLGLRLSAAFTRSREGESDLGDLVADVLKETISGAQVGLMNSGGLRSDIEAGEVTYGRVFNALPFDNRVSALQLTGAELAALIARGVNGTHGILQVSGLRVQALDPTVKPCTKDGSRLVSVMLENGAPLVPTDMYSVVTNDFVAGGGDDFDKVLNQVDPGRIVVKYDLPPVREALVVYLRFHPEITKPMPHAHPRIEFVTPKCNGAPAETTTSATPGMQ